MFISRYISIFWLIANVIYAKDNELQESDSFLLVTSFSSRGNFAPESTLLFLRSLRLYGGILNNVDCEICYLGDNSLANDGSDFVALGASLHNIDLAIRTASSVRNDEEIGILCLASVSSYYSNSTIYQHILYINPAIIVVGDILASMNLYRRYLFGCVAGANSNICDSSIYYIRSVMGSSLRNVLLTSIDYSSHISISELVYNFCWSYLSSWYMIPSAIILSSAKDRAHGHSDPLVYLDNVNERGERDSIRCPANSAQCTRQQQDDTSECHCEVRIVPPFHGLPLTLIDRLLGSKILRNQTACRIVSGCIPLPHSSMPPASRQVQKATRFSVPYIPKVFDVFPFNDELTLLRVRMELLKDVVHRFVLIEARHTHSGHPKPLYFDQNKELFPQSLLDRTVHVIVDLPAVPLTPSQSAWTNVRAQMDFLVHLIDEKSPQFRLALDTRDVLLITELDEIPRPSAVRTMCDIARSPPPASHRAWKFSMDYFLYNLSTPVGDFLTTHPYAVTYGHVMDTYYGTSSWEMFPSLVRTGEYGASVPYANIIARAGWHLCNFKSLDGLRRKLESNAHQEFNTPQVKRMLAQRVQQGLPMEAIVDNSSRALNSNNVFLEKKPRKLTARERADPEYRRLEFLWSQFATVDDTPFASRPEYEHDQGENRMSDEVEVEGGAVVEVEVGREGASTKLKKKTKRSKSKSTKKVRS